MTTRVRAEMPDVVRPRERGWWIPVAGFAVLAIAFYAWAWNVASEPNGYAGYRFSQQERTHAPHVWLFPMKQMVEVGGWIVGELAVILVTFAWRAEYLARKRAVLVGLLILGFAFVMALPLVMHASAPYPHFFLLQLAAGLGFVLYALVSKGLARRRSIR